MNNNEDPKQNPNWQDIPDIYSSSSPVEDDLLFVGRETQIKEIINSIEKNEPVCVIGKRRMGRTSLLKYIQRNYLEKSDQYIPVFISAENLEYGNTNNFLYSFIAFSDLGEILIEKGIIEKDFLENKLESIKNEGIFEFNDLFNKILKKTKSLNQKLIILIDEFPLIHNQILNGNIDSQFISKLRENLQQNNSVFNIIYSGGKNIKYIRRNYSSNNLVGVGISIEVSFFNEIEVNLLISKPLNNLMEFEPSAFEYFMDLTYGQPMLSQRLLDSLVKKLNNQKTGHTVFKEYIDELLPRLIDNTEYLATFWDFNNYTDNSDEEISYKKLIISCITDNWKKEQTGLKYEQLYSIIDKAVNKYFKINIEKFDEILSLLAESEDILLLKNHLYFIKVGLFRELVIKYDLTFEKVKNSVIEQYLKGGSNEQ